MPCCSCTHFYRLMLQHCHFELLIHLWSSYYSSRLFHFFWTKKFVCHHSYRQKAVCHLCTAQWCTRHRRKCFGIENMLFHTHFDSISSNIENHWSHFLKKQQGHHCNKEWSRHQTNRAVHLRYYNCTIFHLHLMWHVNSNQLKKFQSFISKILLKI